MIKSPIEGLIADARTFYEFGWLLGTSGNLSVRSGADEFRITASGRDKGRLTWDDFLTCDLFGSPTGDETGRPSAETLVHCVIYDELEDARAVYHVHEPYAALCSNRDEALGSTRFRDLEMIKGLDIWDVDEVDVPIVPNYRDIPELAEAIREHVHGRAPAVNIVRHGFYAWGKSPFEAKRHVETLAYLYRYSWENWRALSQ